MERDTVVGAIMAGNEAAMQWYAMSHQVPLPAPQYGTGVSLGPTGLNATVGSGGLLIVGLIVVGAIVLLAK